MRLNPCEGSGSVSGGASYINWDPCKRCGERHRPELCPKSPWLDAAVATLQPEMPAPQPEPVPGPVHGHWLSESVVTTRDCLRLALLDALPDATGSIINRAADAAVGVIRSMQSL